jgi:hypothetical protein
LKEMSRKAFQAEFPIEIIPQSDSAPVTSLCNDWECTDTQVTFLETDSCLTQLVSVHECGPKYLM